MRQKVSNDGAGAPALKRGYGKGDAWGGDGLVLPQRRIPNGPKGTLVVSLWTESQGEREEEGLN